ncbi:hypothetical protein PO909_010213 [Leuciscus waleckii]
MHEVNDTHSKKMSEFDSRLHEVERYKRRWNLRLYSLTEQTGEDVKAQVVDICCAILPELTTKIQQDVDTVYWLGRKLEENARRGRTGVAVDSVPYRNLCSPSKRHVCACLEDASNHNWKYGKRKRPNALAQHSIVSIIKWFSHSSNISVKTKTQCLILLSLYYYVCIIYKDCKTSEMIGL